MRMRLAMVATFFRGVAAGASAASTETKTCQSLKDKYSAEQCCGKQPSAATSEQWVGYCPYTFTAPDCTVAGPQSPKDLTTDRISDGNRFSAAPVMHRKQMNDMELVNVHFHLGAEHKSDAYNSNAVSDSGTTFTAGGHDVRAGWWATGTAADFHSTRASATPVGSPCEDLYVGDTIEVHWVHSSAGKQAAGSDDPEGTHLTDGLGNAANGRNLLNPMLHVEGTVYSIVSDDTAETVFDPGKNEPEKNKTLLDYHMPKAGENDYVRYVGSSTGQSFTGNFAAKDQLCSPYVINWGVDLRLHKVKNTTMVELCQALKKNNIVTDLKPHGSRVLLHQLFVSAKYEKGTGCSGSSCADYETSMLDDSR